MNDTGYVGLVDTNRGELRERIALARGRFDRLVRTADPDARVPRSEWTVQQTVAHVLTVAHRYQGIARGTDYHRAGNPRELDAINQDELEAVLAPIPELADQLQALAPEMDAYFDTHTDDEPTIPFHHAFGGGLTWQTNWLGELLFHGHDVARAVKRAGNFPNAIWRSFCGAPFSSVLHGSAAISAPLPTSASRSRSTEHVHTSSTSTTVGPTIRERRAEDRPDAVLKCSALIFTRLLYQRTGPLVATLRGSRIVAGRRPWLALRLQSCFERP